MTVDDGDDDDDVWAIIIWKHPHVHTPTLTHIHT